MQDLSTILIKLSQKILNTSEDSKLKLSKILLNSLDPQFFTEGFLIDISTFSQLNTQICNFYKEKFDQKIIATYFFTSQHNDRFVLVFRLIMDLALNGERKEQFLNSILQMNETQKNLLMEFVAEVVRRDDFIDFDKEEHTNFTSQLSTENMAIQEQILELKEDKAELQKKYFELFQAHSTLKKSHEKISSQISHLKQEKLQLLGELGLHHNSGYGDIIQKYRKQVNDFTKDIERMQTQVQQKSSLLKSKQKEQQELVLGFSFKQQHLSQSYQQKLLQLLKKQETKDRRIQEMKEKQDQYRFQVVRLKDAIIDLRRQIQQKNSKLYQQETTIDKFNKMKKLHLQFRKAMIDNYRNGVSVISSGGIGF